MSSLFRKEAVEARGQKFSNPIRVDGVPSVNMALGLFGALFLGLIIFGLKVDYQRKVDVNGYLAPEGGAITLSPDISGVLNILVGNGTRVKAGDHVATLRSEQTDSGGASRHELEIASLERRLALINSRLQITSQDLENVEPNLQTDIDMLMGQVKIADGQMLLAESELRLASDAYQKQNLLLDRGLTTVILQSQAEQTKIAVEQKLLTAKERISTLVADIARRKKNARDLKSRLRRDLITMTDETEVIEDEIRQIRSNQETAITAPVDGVLTFVQAQQHERATAGQPLFKIRQDGAEQMGVLLAPSWAIGFLEVGDVVRIRYRAFPYQEYGVFSGRVRSFDEAAQAPSEIDAPTQVTEPVFRVFVEIDQKPLSKGGEPLRLSQGMIFEASVVIDERPVIWWLLDPVV